ncbi:DUF421 domain-containing protein [Larkinella sp. VNQ87]|uniref:DUF421 domain-containing protein n=1 Tax=Larkinella sp. VNQ87 TaxID=3400921 RepID=UPI003C0CA57C
MKKEAIFFEDWQRILIGNAPVEFMLEVFLRTVVIYLILLVVLRLLGKRMNSQLTNLEMAVMLSMGAILAPAMQLPDRGVLSGILAMFCALLFLRLTNLLGFKSRKSEQLIQGTETMLIKDGIIQCKTMAKNRLSHQQVYAVLRKENIYNLSKVKRLYLEAYGLFSLYTNEEDRPGLSVLPAPDDEIHTLHRMPDEPLMACSNCGFTQSATTRDKICPSCGAGEWVKAVI